LEGLGIEHGGHLSWDHGCIGYQYKIHASRETAHWRGAAAGVMPLPHQGGAGGQDRLTRLVRQAG